MNARQKAKMYKRMLDKLLNQPVKFNVVTPKVDTLRYEQFFDEDLLAQPEHIKYIRRGMRAKIAEELVSELNNYINFSTEYQPDLHRYRVCGEIKVVDIL